MKYGLKLWSNNVELFDEAVAAHASQAFDFIELYSNPAHKPDFEALKMLKALPVTIHATHIDGFHEFVIGEKEEAIWKQTLELADFFESEVIVIHPGRAHTFNSFKENLDKIDDSRIYIENMAGLDVDKNPMFGQELSHLERMRELRPICFDFEKAVKAACYQKKDYKEYIEEALQRLKPSYFHISGGDKDNPVDEHLNLQAANFDVAWMKRQLEAMAQPARLVFETPKAHGIENDIANMVYFRSL